MRMLARTATTAAALALVAAAGLMAGSTTASAQDVRVRVGVNDGYNQGYYNRGYYHRPYYNTYRTNRYYYSTPNTYYYQRPYYRSHRYGLHCRWVPGEGRVCW